MVGQISRLSVSLDKFHYLLTSVFLIIRFIDSSVIRVTNWFLIKFLNIEELVLCILLKLTETY